MVASFGFFFLPLLEIKPNRLASGLTVGLLELEGDLRYPLLFFLVLSAILLAFLSDQSRRGWSLVAVGNLAIFLTLMLPAVAATDILQSAETLFEEGTQISNPRILTSGGLALGLLGSYIIMFGGLLDLEKVGVTRWLRALVSALSVLGVLYLLRQGTLDDYSILVEFRTRGETLNQRFIEHIVFVIVSIIAGLIIGISLGLWASRDERAETFILYAVGIIQTIPSLALFGVLLVPMAKFGDRDFLEVFYFWLASTLLAVVVVGITYFFLSKIPEGIRQPTMILSFLVAFVPLSILVVLTISFGFEIVLEAFQIEDLSGIRTLILVGIFALLVLPWINQRLGRVQYVRWAQYGVAALVGIGIIYLLYKGGDEFLPNNWTLDELTIRDLGVSGIGTAPAIIALTLYSLLPLVRNTYAGLTNIDPAIIDSGRGMGMTPGQIFFQIELPLAFPIIMAGVRNAAISLVGIAAVATVIGAGALGDFILQGVNNTAIDLIMLGAIPAIILAVILDAGLQLIERLLTSPGIRET